MASKICEKCNKEAEFIAPKNLCREHWARWWACEDSTLPLEIQEIAYNETMKELNKKFGKSNGKASDI